MSLIYHSIKLNASEIYHMGVYQLLALGLNDQMDEKDIFKANLLTLIKVAADSGALKKSVAERLGYEPARFSHLTSPSNYRAITPKQARAIEDNLGRPKYWLDELRTTEELAAAWAGASLKDNTPDGISLYDDSISGKVSLSLSEVHVPPRTVSVPLTRDLRDIDALDSGRMRMRPGTKTTHFLTDFTLSDNAVAYQLTDGLLDPVFEIGTIFVFDPAVKPKARRPALVEIAGAIAVRLYRPLFGEVFELYTPSGALGILRSDQVPIKILAGMLRAVLEDEQSCH